jgi:hypothetical protein
MADSARDEHVEIRLAGPGMGAIRVRWVRRGAIDRLLGFLRVTGHTGAARLRPPSGVDPRRFAPMYEYLTPQQLASGATAGVPALEAPIESGGDERGADLAATRASTERDMPHRI